MYFSYCYQKIKNQQKTDHIKKYLCSQSLISLTSLSHKPSLKKTLLCDMFLHYKHRQFVLVHYILTIVSNPWMKIVPTPISPYTNFKFQVCSARCHLTLHTAPLKYTFMNELFRMHCWFWSFNNVC